MAGHFHQIGRAWLGLNSTHFNDYGETCSICLEAMKEGQAIYIGECGHYYHYPCIHHYAQGNQNNVACPTDRKRLTIYGMSDNRDTNEEAHEGNGDESLASVGNEITTTAAEMVKVEIAPEFSEITDSSFDMLITLRGLNRNVKVPVDVVCVVNTGPAMTSHNRLETMKRLVSLIIHNLQRFDRLSIVTFADTAVRLLPLIKMTEQGHDKAFAVLNNINTGLQRLAVDISLGLREGVNVLNERSQRNVACSIVLISGGQDGSRSLRHRENVSSLSDPLHIPLNLIRLSDHHVRSTLSLVKKSKRGQIKFLTMGTENGNVLNEQLVRYMVRLAATDLQVEITPAIPEVSVQFNFKSCLESYDPISVGKPCGESINIQVSSLNEEQAVNLLVSVNAKNEHGQGSARTNMDLISVKCMCRDPIDKYGMKTTVDKGVFNLGVQHPYRNMDFDTQRNLMATAKGINRALLSAETENDFHNARRVLEILVRRIRSSASDQDGERITDKVLHKLNDLITRGMENHEAYEKDGRGIALSANGCLSLDALYRMN